MLQLIFKLQIEVKHSRTYEVYYTVIQRGHAWVCTKFRSLNFLNLSKLSWLSWTPAMNFVGKISRNLSFALGPHTGIVSSACKDFSDDGQEIGKGCWPANWRHNLRNSNIDRLSIEKSSLIIDLCCSFSLLLFTSRPSLRTDLKVWDTYVVAIGTIGIGVRHPAPSTTSSLFPRPCTSIEFPPLTMPIIPTSI